MDKKNNKKIAGKIFTEIKKANKILLALHVSPDGDAFSSVLSLDLVLRRMKKKTKIISYSSWTPKFNQLPGVEKIEIADFAKIDLSQFDLFISLDSADKTMITRSQFPQKFPPEFKTVNIDHHFTNTKYGSINLIQMVSSTAELLYELFKYWGIKIDKKLAKTLLFGIFTDTGCFQYPNTSPKTLLTVANLMGKRASLKDMVLFYYRSYPLNTLKYWGKVLEKMQMDESQKFVWATLNKEEIKNLGVNSSEIEGAASLFAPVVSGIEFGIILIEETDGFVRGSLRSRQDFDVAKIAVELGGGGHKAAAGFSLELPLQEAEKKVLETARKYVRS